MMTRRGWAIAGVASAAAGAGLGWRWWAAAPPAASNHAPEGSEAAVDVWTLRFEMPAGGEVALAPLRGKPLVLNFWATWCPPCVEEMPLLDRFQRDHGGAGWSVMGLAVDNAEPVRQFLAAHPVDFAIGLAGMEGVTLSRSLGNTRGALPFSVIFDRQGNAVERRLGSWTGNDLTAWVGRVA